MHVEQRVYDIRYFSLIYMTLFQGVDLRRNSLHETILMYDQVGHANARHGNTWRSGIVLRQVHWPRDTFLCVYKTAGVCRSPEPGDKAGPDSSPALL